METNELRTPHAPCISRRMNSGKGPHAANAGRMRLRNPNRPIPTPINDRLLIFIDKKPTGNCTNAYVMKNAERTYPWTAGFHWKPSYRQAEKSSSERWENIRPNHFTSIVELADWFVSFSGGLTIATMAMDNVDLAMPRKINPVNANKHKMYLLGILSNISPMWYQCFAALSDASTFCITGRCFESRGMKRENAKAIRVFHELKQWETKGKQDRRTRNLLQRWNKFDSSLSNSLIRQIKTNEENEHEQRRKRKDDSMLDTLFDRLVSLFFVAPFQGNLSSFGWTKFIISIVSWSRSFDRWIEMIIRWISWWFGWWWIISRWTIGMLAS